jgi:hypothetical protein
MIEINNFFLDKKFLQDIFSALIGTGTALLIFYITIRKDRNKEKLNFKRQTNNQIRNFKNLINSSIKHAETTISNLDEMINNYENDLLKFQLLRFSPNKSFERLDELLKNEDYFQAYSKKYGKENVNTYNSLSLIIDYFYMQINQLWEIIEKAQEFDHKRKIKFNEQSTFIITSVARLTVTPNTGISVEDLATLNTIVVDFHEKITEDASLVYLYEFNRRVLENVLIHYIGNPIAMQIIELIRDSSVLFDEIHKQNTSHKNDLVGIKNEMNEVLNRYKEQTQNLR